MPSTNASARAPDERPQSAADEPPVPAAIRNRLVGDARVVGTVGQPLDRPAAAEEEIRSTRISDRPMALVLGELENGTALAERNDVLDQLRFRLGLELVSGCQARRERRVAARGRARHTQHVRMGPRLAWTRNRR